MVGRDLVISCFVSFWVNSRIGSRLVMIRCWIKKTIWLKFLASPIFQTVNEHSQ